MEEMGNSEIVISGECHIQNPNVDALVKRLQTLTGDLDFTWDDRSLDSPEVALKTGERYSRNFDRLDEMGEERRERVMNLHCTIFATMLQAIALKEYGNDNITSIRKVMEDIVNGPEYQSDYARLSHTIKASLVPSVLTQDKYDLLLKGTIDEFPSLMVDWFTGQYEPYRFLPLSEAQPITTALAEMIREVAT